MPLSSSSKENISIKKLVGKAHTSNALEAFNESKSTGITISASSVIANAIPNAPTSTNLYDITSSVVEYVRLVATPLNESIVDGKYHAFKLSLPADYSAEGNSQNESAGAAPFVNSQDLFSSNGSLQIIPPSFADAYEAKVYYGGDGVKGSGTRIPLLDNRSWYLDYFSGILFQEVPPDNEAQNPEYVEAYIYIGQMASERFIEGGGGGGASQLSDLTDVTIGNVALAQNQVLVYTANNVFENQTFSSTQLSDTADLIRATSSIASLSDVHSIDGIADGNVLAWNSDNNRFEFTAPAVTYTDEEARNAAGSALAGGTHTGIAFVNNDVGNTIDATVSLDDFSIGDLSDIDLSDGTSDGKILKWSTDKFVLADDVDTNTQLSDEEVQDIVGAMVTENTESDLTVVYNDDSGKLDFSVNNTIARIDSPIFTGTPSAPTAGLDTNTTQIATTEFVQTQINSDITDLNLGSAAQSDTTDFIAAGSSIDVLSNVDISTDPPENGQVLKWDGSNFVPSDDIDTNTDTQLSDEEVQDIVGAMVDANTETDITVEYDDANGKLNFSVDNTIARLDDPDFTGTPTAPTAVIATDSTQIATTSFVHSLIDSDIAALNATLATTYQPLDAGLTSISSLTTESDKLIYTTDSDTYATSTLTAFARTLLDDGTAADVRVTLGLGTAAVKDQEFFLLSDSGINDLSDVLISAPDDAHILVYDNDAGENDDKWKNVALTGDVTISNLGVTTIGENKVTNDKLLNSSVTITDGTTSDVLPLGQALTINSVANETTVTVTADAGAGADGVEITIGLPDDVTIGRDLLVSQDLTVSRNLVVTGDFTVNGSSSTISTTNLDVEDSIISLNNGIIGNDPDNNPVANPATRDIGFFFDRGSLNPTLIFWDEADDVFKLGSHSGEITSTSSDLGDAGNGFSYEYLKVATAKDENGDVDPTSSDNTAATTEWVSTKVSSEITSLNLGTAAENDTEDFIAAGSSIDVLADVDTTGKASGKILQFNGEGNLVAADAPDTFSADTSSLWAEASTTNDDGEADLFPHGIIDGTLDTGMFAINLSAGSMNFANPNITLHDVLEELSSMNAYTPSTRSANDISDAFFEIYTDAGTGEECIRPK